MAEWSEDHVAAIGSLNSTFGLVGRNWITSDRVGPLGGKCRPSVGKVGE
jgi:hypothetical protein